MDVINPFFTFPEAPEEIPVPGRCVGPLRQYHIKRLDEANVRRSLAGALSRAEGWLAVMISTRAGTKLPEYLETLHRDIGWDLFEAYCRGEVRDGWLECFINEKDSARICYQMAIRLSAIQECDVSYCEKVASA